MKKTFWYMKKRFLLVMAACTLTMYAVAQTPRFEVMANQESKKVDDEFVRESKYIGQYDGLYCFVGEGRRHSKVLTLVDHNMVPLRSMTLPESTVNCKFITGSVVGNNAGLLFMDNDERHRAFIYTATMDLDSMRSADSVGLRMIDSVGFSRKDNFMLWAATSENGQYNAMIQVLEFTESRQYSAKVTLFDGRMHKLWSKDYAIGSMENLYVTNNGTVVSLGREPEGEETRFVYNIVSEKRANTYAAIVKCDPIRELRLAGVVDNHVLAVGLFTPQGARERDNLCGGVVGISFDMDSAIITGFTMRPFMNEDMNILLNKKTKKVQRSQQTDLVSLVGTTLTENGVVMAVGRNYAKDNVENNGTITHLFYRMGLHLVAIDTQGRISWVRNIRRNDYEVGDDGMLNVCMLHNNGRTYIIKSEHRKYPAIYDIAKDVKEYKVGSKGNLVVYAIDSAGEVEKTIVYKKTPYGVVRGVLRADGKIALFTQNGSRTRIVELKAL